MKLVRILSFILCLTLLFSTVGMIGSFAVIDPSTLVPDSDKRTALDFFKSVGATEAVAILKADKLKKTKLGNSLDATNLNNLMNAVQMIRDVNANRAKEAKLENRNLPELKITHRLMANAIINCNYSSGVRAHSNNYETGYTAISECLSWGSSDPALVWYDYPGYSEKELFKKGDHKNNEDGHYINLYVDSKSYASAHDYELAGAAVSMYTTLNKNGWCCCILSAAGYKEDKVFSVEEYTKLIKDFIGVNGPVFGDITGDGVVLADDARIALRVSAKLEFISHEQVQFIDVDGDGQVLADDARQILRFSAKLQNSFIKKNDI